MSQATPHMGEIYLLRRLAQGPLRFDGVTDYQRRVLTVMHERRWVTLNAASRWDLTPTGRELLEPNR